MKHYYKNYLKVLLILAIEAIILSYIGMSISSSSFYPGSITLPAMGYTLMMVFSFMLLNTSLFNVKAGSIISVLLLMTIAVVDVIKYSMRYAPFIFSDLYIVREVLGIKNLSILNDYWIYIIPAFIIFVTILVMIVRHVHYKVTSEIRLTLFLAALILLSSSFYYMYQSTIPYEESGGIYTFMRSIYSLVKTNDITEEEENEVRTIVSSMRPPLTLPQVKPASQPNIIVIMNEAYWDIEALDLTFNTSPMAYFKELQDQGIHGQVEVPVFAGGTSNTEFESMTGLSTHMFDPGHIIYTTEIDRPIMSLASILRSQGYKASGVHPYWGWFYERFQVYRYLGFDKLRSFEHFNEPDITGEYVTDREGYKAILDELYRTKEPLFLYNVTIQNHGPYDDDRYEEEALTINFEESFDEETTQIIRTYAQGIKDADDALKYLIQGIEASGEETIILFFGDHLPLMGDEMKVYWDTGYLQEDDSFDDNYVKTRTTPFFIWSSHGLPASDIGIIDASFLGPYLLQLAKVNRPMYFDYLLDLYEDVAYINPTFLETRAGERFYYDTRYYEEISSRYTLLIKDMMFGEQFGRDGPSDFIIYDNAGFNEDLMTMSITGEIWHKEYLQLIGHHLYEKAVLFADEDEIDFTFKEGTYLIEEYLAPGTIIEVKLIDDQGDELATSLPYVLEGPEN